VSRTVRRRRGRPAARIRALVLGIFIIGFTLVLTAPDHTEHARAAQSKEECRKCCEGKGYDEYFLEQCKLRCFRDPDHCVGGRQEARPARPPAEEEEAAPRKRRAEFRWPDSVNLVPGSEWETAAQILALNGITPQHPNAAQALQAMEAILTDFVRRNPSGGRLPTAQLERVIRQYR